jgi:hypothetical protein
MSQDRLEDIAKRLATIRDIIMDREGDEVQDQFEVDPYIIIINIEGSGYSDEEEVFTLIQLERGPAGMEELIACAIETEDGDSFILHNEEDNILDHLDEACDKIYRHWHWLDLPNGLAGAQPNDDDLDLEDDF